MKNSKPFFVAFGTLLAVAAVFPISLFVLGLLLTLVFLVTPIGRVCEWIGQTGYLLLTGTLPYLWVGELTYNGTPFQPYLDWPVALLYAGLQWVILAALFSLLARRLAGYKLIAASAVFVVVVAGVTHLICSHGGLHIPSTPLTKLHT
jgi:hypothetical protein